VRNWQAARRTEHVLLGIIVLAGFLVRAIRLQPFAVTHWDEAAIWSGAQFFLSFGRTGDYMALTSPPLPPMLFAVGALFGGVQGAVWVAVIFGSANIALIYFLTKKLLSPAGGFAAAVMLAASGLNVMYSRSLLTETFYVFFLLCTLLASVWYLRARTLVPLLIVALSAASLQYTKYNGALAACPLLAVLAYEVLTVRDQRQKWRSAVHIALVGAIISAAIFVNIAALWFTGSLADFKTHYSHYVGKAAASPGAIPEYVGMVTPITVLCLAAGGLIFVLLRKRNTDWTIVHIGFVLYVAFLFSYTFYLRLLAPVSIFLIVYASAAVFALIELLPAKIYIPVIALVGVAFVLNTWQDFPRYFERDHGGYARAAAYLNSLPSSTRVIMATQQNVWTDLRRPVVFTSRASPRELEKQVADSEEIVLVTDIYAYYKYAPRVVPAFVNRLSPDREIRTISNPLRFDLVENSLTLEELKRFESDPELRDQVYSIRVYKLSAEELRQLSALLRESRH